MPIVPQNSAIHPSERSRGDLASSSRLRDRGREILEDNARFDRQDPIYHLSAIPYRRSARLAIRDPKKPWVIAWRLAREKSRREKPVCPQKCERVQIIPDSITVIMPVIYVLHTHARTHERTPFHPSPR